MSVSGVRRGREIPEPPRRPASKLATNANIPALHLTLKI